MDEAQKKLLNYAVWLLARRRYHSAELKSKIIKRKQATTEEAEEIIRKLDAYKYINDQEYITLYIREQLLRKPQGMMLIKQKLLQKNIPAEEIAAAVQAYGGPKSEQQSELEEAQKALHKKLQTLKTATPQQKKEKLYRFLASRGFSSQTILKALGQF